MRVSIFLQKRFLFDGLSYEELFLFPAQTFKQTFSYLEYWIAATNINDWRTSRTYGNWHVVSKKVKRIGFFLAVKLTVKNEIWEKLIYTRQKRENYFSSPCFNQYDLRLHMFISSEGTEMFFLTMLSVHRANGIFTQQVTRPPFDSSFIEYLYLNLEKTRDATFIFHGNRSRFARFADTRREENAIFRESLWAKENLHPRLKDVSYFNRYSLMK